MVLSPAPEAATMCRPSFSRFRAPQNRDKGCWMFPLTTVGFMVGALIAGQITLLPKSMAPTRGGDTDRNKLAVPNVPRRSIPLYIKPLQTFKDQITNEELARVVAVAEPSWPGPGVGLMLHAIRLWGPDTRFEGAWQVPGRSPLYSYPTDTQVSVLLDHSKFRSAFRQNFSLPWFIRADEMGVYVITHKDADMGSSQGQFHPDQLLQVLAEAGLDLAHPVRPALSPGKPEGAYDVSSILDESLWMYSPNQEPEFTATAYSRWLLPPAEWANRFGERCSLNILSDRLLQTSIGEGSCGGTHVCYALVNLLRADEESHFLTKETTEGIRRRLREVSATLTRTQSEDGAWSLDWAGPHGKKTGESPWFLEVDPYPKVLITGHHLEWIAIAPPDLSPPPRVARGAILYLKRVLLEQKGLFYGVSDVYPLCTHAVRALCLIRCVEARDVHSAYPAPPISIPEE